MDKKCPKCDHLNHYENNRCWYCGFNLVNTPGHSPPGESTVSASRSNQITDVKNKPRRQARDTGENINSGHVQEACPNCGRNEIKADTRYGNKLIGREYMRQILRSPVFWIGIALVGLPELVPGLRVPGQIPLRLSLEALGFVLILISSIRVYRRIFDPAAAKKYPSTRYTCLQCQQQWTSDDTQTEVPQESDEMKIPARKESQESEEDILAESPTFAPLDTRAPPPSVLRGPAKGTATIIGLLVLLVGFSILSCFGGFFLMYALTGCAEVGCPWVDPVIIICGIVLPVVFAVIVVVLRYRSRKP